MKQEDIKIINDGKKCGLCGRDTEIIMKIKV